jgi:hypothetical protein
MQLLYRYNLEHRLKVLQTKKEMEEAFKAALQARVGRVGTFHDVLSRTRVMGWHFSRCSVQNSGYGLALFTMFCPELGLWVGTFHRVIL